MNLKKSIGVMLAAVCLVSTIPIAAVHADSRKVTPTSIQITGTKNKIAVGSKLDLDAKLTPRNAEDDYVMWTSSNSSVAKVLDKYDDDTEIKGIKAGTAVITASVKGTNLKDTYQVTVVEKTTETVASTDKKLEAVKNSISALETEIEKIKVPSGRSARKATYRTYEKKLDAIDKKLDAYEDDYEDMYRAGKISKSVLKAKKRVIDRLEDRLDDLEDLLEDMLDLDD